MNKNKYWDELSDQEQEVCDSSCNSGKHGRLTRETGPIGGTGDYICTICGILKSEKQWKKEGLM